MRGRADIATRNICAAYLLAPVSDAVFDALATVGAETEDMEP